MGNPLAQLRNSQKENLQVKAGETPIEWNQQENKSVKEGALIAVNIESRISEKGSRNHPLTAEQKASNTEKSRIISKDEIIFSAPNSHGSTLRSNNRNDESGLQYNPSGDPSGDPPGDPPRKTH